MFLVRFVVVLGWSGLCCASQPKAVASPNLDPKDLSVRFQPVPKRILEDLAETVHPPIYQDEWRFGAETQTVLVVEDTIRIRRIAFDTTTNTERVRKNLFPRNADLVERD